jgi:hypothetical protein
MTDNLRHWHALGKTDPAQTKPFRRQGGFAGTAVKPIYTEHKMTEHFGPCGIGWGMDKPEFQIQPANNEMLVFCTLRVWYKDGDQRGELYGVGGDKIVATQKSGPFVNDEALKAAFTDALSNALKHLGVSADVHMGRFDDHKYVNEMRAEFAGEPAPHSASPACEPEQDPFVEPTDPEARKNEARGVFARVRAAISAQRNPGQIDALIATATKNGELALIKEAHRESHDLLMRIAQARKDELTSSPP